MTDTANPVDTAAPQPDAGAPDARAALIAELESLGPDGNPVASTPAEEPAAEALEGAEGEAGGDEVEAEPEPEGDDDEAQASDGDEVTEDPELAKRLDAIQRAEKRSREQVEQARRELDLERRRIEQELAPQREALARYEAAAKRAKYDPVGALASLGLGPDDFEAAARAVYAASTAAQADPKLREQAARTLREREAADEVAKLRQEQEQLRAQMEAERSQRQLDAYLDTVSRSVGDATPLVGALVANDPGGARDELARVAQQLYAQTGEVPDPGDVAAELEKTERARLKRLGISVPAPGQKVAQKTPNPAPTGETKPGKTITSNMAATPATPRTEPKTEAEVREDILANWPT